MPVSTENNPITLTIVQLITDAPVVGPFLWGPLSEVFGRVRVLQVANLIYLLFNTVCGFAQTKEQMMAFRFLSGIGGSAPQAVGLASSIIDNSGTNCICRQIGGGVLSDCFRAEDRGSAIAVYSLMPFIGPALGPVGKLCQAFVLQRVLTRDQPEVISPSIQHGDGSSGQHRYLMEWFKFSLLSF